MAGDPTRTTTTLDSVQTQEHETGGIGDPVTLARAAIRKVWKGKDVSPVLAETAYFEHLLKSTDEGKVLGVGAFGEAFKVVDSVLQHEFALKRMK